MTLHQMISGWRYEFFIAWVKIKGRKHTEKPLIEQDQSQRGGKRERDQ